MRCEYDNEIVLRGLNQLHREILLGDAVSQETIVENLVRLVRFFTGKNSHDSLAEELENLERAVQFMIAGGEIKSCRFPELNDALAAKSVERFSVFDACFAALSKGARDGKNMFAVWQDEAAGTLAVKAMVH